VTSKDKVTQDSKESSEVQSSEVLDPEVLDPEVLDPEEKAEEEKAEEEKKLSPMEELQEQLKKKDEELTELKNDFLREKADLENFRKRLVKDKSDSVQFANQRLLKELVEIDDNMDRALNTPNTSLESLKEGVEMIQKQFSTFLKNQKVEPIEAIGKPFDPSLHEVMTQLESEEHNENTVMQEYSKGYTLNGRILRSAKVVISTKPTEETQTPIEEKSIEGEE
jgi:molecular chaperone GrpE